MTLEQYARDAANPQNEAYRKLSSLPSWDAVIECALGAGAISRERAAQLMSIDWGVSFSKFVSRDDPRVRNADGMKRVPAGAFMAFIEVDRSEGYHAFVEDGLGRRHIIHAMVSLGNGRAAGNGNSVLGIEGPPGWHVLDLTKLNWIPHTISFNAVPLGTKKSRPLRIRYRELEEYQKPITDEHVIDLDEIRAIRSLERSILTNTEQMFKGAKLTGKTTKKLADLKDVALALESFVSAVQAVDTKGEAQAGDDAPVRTLLSGLFDGTPEELIREALGETFTEIIARVEPFVGTIKSGTKAIINWATLAKQSYARYKAAKAEVSFSPGDPAAAFAAILECQQREMKNCATVASILTISTVAKTSFLTVDFGVTSGPLLNAAEKLSLLVQKIYLYARDWIEMDKANKLLAVGPFDLSLFKANPLLGCYLIANSDTSHVINMAVADYGQEGWRTEVETMVEKAQPVFKAARSVINSSRYQIASMMDMKGGTVDQTSTTLKLPIGKLSAIYNNIVKRINRASA